MTRLTKILCIREGDMIRLSFFPSFQLVKKLGGPVDD
jgi:hypothetical protein